MDLQDLYNTDLETISFLFLIECMGSLLASFLSKLWKTKVSKTSLNRFSFPAGFLMTRYSHLNNLFMFLGLCALGLVTAFIPYAGDLERLFVLLFFCGFLVAAVHTGAFRDHFWEIIENSARRQMRKIAF